VQGKAIQSHRLNSDTVCTTEKFLMCCSLCGFMYMTAPILHKECVFTIPFFIYNTCMLKFRFVIIWWIYLSRVPECPFASCQRKM
jgi:hypothetical protein